MTKFWSWENQKKSNKNQKKCQERKTQKFVVMRFTNHTQIPLLYIADQSGQWHPTERVTLPWLTSKSVKKFFAPCANFKFEISHDLLTSKIPTIWVCMMLYPIGIFSYFQILQFHCPQAPRSVRVFFKSWGSYFWIFALSDQGGGSYSFLGT